MKLGIVGPIDLVRRSIKIGRKIIDANFIELPYDDEDQTIDIVNEHESELDAILFTGILPYYQATIECNTKIPLYYYPISGSSIYRTLFIMKVKHNINIERISIDTPTEIDIDSIYEELDLDSSQIICNNLSITNFNRQRCIEFHTKLFTSNMTEGAITSINSVYDELKRRKIPTFKIIPTRNSITSTFDSIDSSTKRILAERKETVILIATMDKEYFVNNPKVLEHLYDSFVTYGKALQASIFCNYEEGEITLLFAKGILLEYTEGFKYCPFVEEIEENLGFKIYIGIGLGVNSHIAESNAKRALSLSITNKNGPYLVDANKVAKGPLGTKETLTYQLKCTDEKLLRISEKSNVSIVNLTKIKSLIHNAQTNRLTAADIKVGLNLNSRSANRLLNKLCNGGVAHSIGIEQNGAPGRPKTVYEILL